MALAPYPWLEDAARDLLALKSRLPNAILIHGPAGTGTFDLARAFAESLLCESPLPDGSACGKCAGCRLVKAGTHPDLRIVVSEYLAGELGLPYQPPENASGKTKPSREIRIHQFRALSDFVTMTAHRGGRRAVLVYPADMIRAEAAASLLKTMEEPPEGLVFVLAADDIDAVLPTIRSRARLLRIGMPDRKQALAWLKTQKRIADPEEALAMAGGAPLLALKDPSGHTLAPKDQAALKALLAKGASLSGDEIVRGYSAGMAIPAVALYFSRWCYDLMRVKCGAEPFYFVHDGEALARIARGTSAGRLSSLNAAAAEMRRYAEHPLSPRQVWEGVLILYAHALGGR
jgi:DNA polymerase-3 subunit delta'